MRKTRHDPTIETHPAKAEGARLCLNCQTPLAGDFCHQCGQSARIKTSFQGIVHDLAHGVIHFEGKLWRTLPELALRPGALTRGYIEGQRVRFLSPTATFLLAVFLMFAVFSSIGREAYYVEKASARAAPGQTSDEPELPIDLDLGDAPAPLRAIDEAWRSAKQNPSLLAYKLQSNAYKYSWALIPISVPLVWLLFLHRQRYRRRYKAYHHTIFATYSIAFMSFFAIVYTLLKLLGMIGTIALLPFAIPPLHMFLQLRDAYILSNWSALWRAVGLVIFAMVALVLFFTFLLLFGLLG